MFENHVEETPAQEASTVGQLQRLTQCTGKFTRRAIKSSCADDPAQLHQVMVAHLGATKSLRNWRRMELEVLPHHQDCCRLSGLKCLPPMGRNGGSLWLEEMAQMPSSSILQYFLCQQQCKDTPAMDSASPTLGDAKIDALENKEKVCEGRHSLSAVEGAICSLREKSKNHERVSSASQLSFRQKIAVTVGTNKNVEFCPSYHGNVQHLTTGAQKTTLYNNKVVTQSPSLDSLRPLTPIQKLGATSLPLYIPTASYEEEESNTSRKKNEAPNNKDSRFSEKVSKVDPIKPLVQKPSRRMTDKWTRIPSKEALSTANLSIHFCGDSKRLYLSPTRRRLIDNTRNRFLLGEDTNIRNPIQRPVSNIGYRLGSYHSDTVAESNEYGLNVSTLKLNDDKPQGLYLLNERRGLDKMESFLRRKKEHEMNVEESTRCKSQLVLLDLEKRKTYI
ncbi:uncharacterized protein LOC142658916 [Rhinoderma darwinii]|uniref:uncharacterized protein LOC142658916 n=1 Tax=Rhinoderma darwinii TaxID=43563 RepID=UPI003F672FBD